MASPQSAREFFEALPGRIDADRAAQLENSYAFDIAGAGQWTVAPGGDGIAVTEGIGEADVTISTSEDVFLRIVSGDQNPTTAYMTGKLKMKGDMGAALKLQKLF